MMQFGKILSTFAHQQTGVTTLPDDFNSYEAKKKSINNENNFIERLTNEKMAY